MGRIELLLYSLII